MQTDKRQDIDQLCVNTIRTLAIDAIQHADSGHPGTPMGMAPTVYCLWQRVLRFDLQDPIWPNRDRFVLSSGHASMLLYTMLHLTGTKAVDPDYEIPGRPSVSKDDLKNFRQLGSRCAGHSEYHWTSGVEIKPAPLGQRVAMSVGMAIAEKWLAARYNRSSLAGHLKLNNLCWIYDSNRVTIEGSTDLAFTEYLSARLKAFGWHVLHVRHANNLESIANALRDFRLTQDRRTLIDISSDIAYGRPRERVLVAAIKSVWVDRVTTVFVRQADSADDPRGLWITRPADLKVVRIGDLLQHDCAG